MREQILAPALVAALVLVAAMPAMADPLEIYYIPSQYYSGTSFGGPDVCAQWPNNICGPVNSIQIFIETPGVDFYPGTTPQNEGGTVTSGGNGSEIDGWSQETIDPQYLSMSGPAYDGILDAYLFVEGSQDFTFDYYFNEASGLVVAGSGTYGEGPCYPINGMECYALGEPLVNLGETPQGTPEPRTWMLIGCGLIGLGLNRKCCARIWRRSQQP
jgi:hypothetical protein